MGNYKLLCFPHAGGSGSMYGMWKSFVNSNIDIVGVEYPGRGIRFKDNLCNNMKELIDDLYDKLMDKIDGDDYALFGHSLGGLVAYEFICRAIERKDKLPMHLFISGCTPPQNERIEEIVHTLPDHEFLEFLISNGGMSDEVIANKEIIDLFLPIIRNDYKLFETYISKKIKIPLNITVLGGTEDRIANYEALNEWNQYTEKECKVYEFEGGHFFIKEHHDSIIKLIDEVLI